MVPGMLITFGYLGAKYDPAPLCLFLGLERGTGATSDDLIHCINFNYLHEADIQRFFKNISGRTNIHYGDKLNLNERYAYVELDKDMRSRGLKAKILYEKVIRPKLLSKDRTSDCYRTYFFNKLTGIRLVNYKIDAIEDEIRKQTGLSKHALKTPELYKNMEEQQMGTSTDNIKIKSQEQIRKDIKE